MKMFNPTLLRLNKVEKDAFLNRLSRNPVVVCRLDIQRLDSHNDFLPLIWYFIVLQIGEQVYGWTQVSRKCLIKERN